MPASVRSVSAVWRLLVATGSAVAKGGTFNQNMHAAAYDTGIRVYPITSGISEKYTL